MQDFTVRVENEHVANAFGLFLTNYGQDAITKFINNVVKNDAGSADAFMLKNKEGVWEIFQYAPDKGWVLAQSPIGVQVATYKSLSTDDKYVVMDGDKLALFVKTPEGQSDLKIGHFLNINEAVTQIESESVNEAVKIIKAGVINAAVDQKKAVKKERQKANRKKS
jgi:hypothetical protein